jgi:hypothetical protein
LVFLEVDGNVSREHAAQLEQAIGKYLSDLRPLRADQFGDYNDGSEVRHSVPLALTQLPITCHLLVPTGRTAPCRSRGPLPPHSPGEILAYASTSG